MSKSCPIQPKEITETYSKAGEILANKALSAYAQASVDELIKDYDGELFPMSAFVDTMYEKTYDPVTGSDYEIFYDKIFDGLEKKYPDDMDELVEDYFEPALKQRFSQYYTEQKKAIKGIIVRDKALKQKRLGSSEYSALKKLLPGVTEDSSPAFISKRAGQLFTQKILDKEKEYIVSSYLLDDIDGLVDDVLDWHSKATPYNEYSNELGYLLDQRDSSVTIDHYIENFFNPSVKLEVEKWAKENLKPKQPKPKPTVVGSTYAKFGQSYADKVIKQKDDDAIYEAVVEAGNAASIAEIKEEFIANIFESAYDPPSNSEQNTFFEKMFDVLEEKFPDVDLDEMVESFLNPAIQKQASDYFDQNKKAIAKKIIKYKKEIWEDENE